MLAKARRTGVTQGPIVFDPEETYIWALAFDDQNRLLVATGQRGRVYRVDAPGPNAKGKVILGLDEAAKPRLVQLCSRGIARAAASIDALILDGLSGSIVMSGVLS